MKPVSEALFCGWGCPRRYWGEANHAPERFQAAIRAATQAAHWEPEHEEALGAMVAQQDASAIREWADSLVWQDLSGVLLERDIAAFYGRVRFALHTLADLVEAESPKPRITPPARARGARVDRAKRA